VLGQHDEHAVELVHAVAGGVPVRGGEDARGVPAGELPGEKKAGRGKGKKAMKVLTVDQAFELLESWTTTLSTHTRAAKRMVRDALSGKTPLPAGCPSSGALAMNAFGNYFGLLVDDCEEITAAVQALCKVLERKAKDE
jgi:hypothetical protein